VASVIVFVASFILHMVLPWHRSDYRRLPSEDEVMESLRRFNIAPGDYAMPSVSEPKEMSSPAFIEKMKRGPVAFLTFRKPGPPTMAPSLAQWFVFTVVVGVFAAYLTGRALGPGTTYLGVFRFAGTTAYLGYGLAMIPNSIWMGRQWSSTLRSQVDALIYGLLTAGAFGWLWPR
jgi:hypothetical protein